VGRARRLAIALVVLVALAALVDWGISRISLEAQRANLERELSAALGREVRLAGELRFYLFPRPALEATEVVVANAPGAASPELLRIERLRLDPALWPLLERRLRLVRLQVDGADLRLEADAAGDQDLLPSLSGLFGEGSSPERPLEIGIDRIDLDRVRVAWLDVASGDYDTLDIDALEIVAEADDDPVEWKARGSFRGARFGFDGKGGTLAAMLHPEGPWPLTLEGHAGEATLRLAGAIAQPTRLEGLDLDVEVELPDLGSVLAPAKTLPGLGAARLRAHLADPGGDPGLDRIVVEPHPDAELRLRVEGSVRKLSDPSGIELDGEVEADQLRVLEYLMERPLPDGRLQVKFQLSDRDGTLGVEGEAHAESRDGSLRVDLAGGFDDLRAVDELDARFRIAAPALDMLGHSAGLDWQLPALGPVAASGRVRARAGTVGVDGLELDAGRRGETWFTVRGSVRDLETLRGVALDASGGARSLASLGRSMRPERSLPELGPFDLRAKFSDARGPLAAQHFALSGGTPATLAVELTGEIADLRQLDAIELAGRLQTRDAAQLGSLIGIELPFSGPVALDGRTRGSDERIESDGSAVLGQTRIEGRWSAEIAGRARPRIVATLRSAHLHLEDIGLGPQPAPDAGDADRGGSRWSARERLPFEELRRLDARLELRAERVSAGGSVDVRDARATVELEDGDLHWRDVGLDYQGGRIAGELRVDARTPDPKLALRADASALDLARLGVALGRPELTGSGQLDLALDLESDGKTPEALWQRLAGRAAFAARDWSSASELARRFLLSLSRAFLPELRKGPERLGCFRGALRLGAGVATVESLVLAGERATIVGAGTVDLVRERWHLELVPDVHQAGLLEIASAVRMTGPLSDPRFDPIPLDLVAGTLRGLVRGALLPAETVTSGAQRVLGPLGKILAPLRTGMRLGARETLAEEAAACVLPEAAAP
jgi:hypothetical protein